MRALFVVTGFGFGDSIRSECIIKEFLKDKKNNVMILGYDFSYRYFKDRFKTLKITGYRFPDYGLEFKARSFLAKNFYLPLGWFLSMKKTLKEVEKFNPDVVISDFEPIANLIAKRIKKKCISIFGYDPKEFNKYRDSSGNMKLQAKYIEGIYKKSDLVIIPSYNAKKNFGNIIYVNPIVRKVRSKNKKAMMKKLNLKRKPFIVMLGGSNYGLELAKKIEIISRKINEDFLFFGGGKKIDEKHFSGFSENYLDYLLVCKGIITLAGELTLSEGLKYKKPMLVFPIKNHVEQFSNSISVKEYAYIAEYQDVNKHVFKFIKNLKFYAKKVKKNKIKFDGERQVVKALKGLK